MVRTRQCDFCGGDIEPGTGTMFVHVDGTTVHFCSAKCEKNADLGREPRDQEWTSAGQAAGGDAVETDPTVVADEPGDGAEPAEPEAETDPEPPDLAAVESEAAETGGEEADTPAGEESTDEPDGDGPTDDGEDPEAVDDETDADESEDAVAAGEASEADSA